MVAQKLRSARRAEEMGEIQIDWFNLMAESCFQQVTIV